VISLKRGFLVISIVFIISLVIFFLIPIQESNTYVEVNGVRINIEIADNFETRAKGLMFRRELQENTGMLFVFENEGNYPFWMMNMRFNLDIIWINSNGKIVFITENMVPCGFDCKVIDPKTNAKYVLEVNAGFVRKYGIKQNSDVRIILPKS